MNNLVNLGDHIGNYIIGSAISGAVGYGLTRTFTILNPVAGATFFGTFIFAGVVVDPVFIENRLFNEESSGSNSSARFVGNTIKFALAYFATDKITPYVKPTIEAIAAEIHQRFYFFTYPAFFIST